VGRLRGSRTPLIETRRFQAIGKLDSTCTAPHLDVRQERVTQAGAGRRALDEAGDVDDLQERLHHGLGLVVVHQPVEALVGDVHAGAVRVDGAEREVLGQRVGLSTPGCHASIWLVTRVDHGPSRLSPTGCVFYHASY
jgi:hypothetical protein